MAARPSPAFSAWGRRWKSWRPDRGAALGGRGAHPGTSLLLFILGADGMAVVTPVGGGTDPSWRPRSSPGGSSSPWLTSSKQKQEPQSRWTRRRHSSGSSSEGVGTLLRLFRLRVRWRRWRGRPRKRRRRHKHPRSRWCCSCLTAVVALALAQCRGEDAFGTLEVRLVVVPGKDWSSRWSISSTAIWASLLSSPSPSSKQRGFAKSSEL